MLAGNAVPLVARWFRVLDKRCHYSLPQDFQMPGLWGPDVFSALTRGSNFITALHKLDHDREQVRTERKHTFRRGKIL